MTYDQFLALASLMVALALVRLAWLARKPGERMFRCARCDCVTEHNERTIEDWRYRKVDFFCDACHAHSLAACEKHPRPAASGCFGVLVAGLGISVAVLAMSLRGLA